MIDGDILSVLQTAAIDAVAKSGKPNLPVKAVAIPFVPPNDQWYVEFVFIPNNREDYWGDERNYAGLFRIIVHAPNNSGDPYEALGLLAQICEPFRKDAVLQNVKISANPNLTGVLEQGSENLYPASIRYQCFVS